MKNYFLQMWKKTKNFYTPETKICKFQYNESDIVVQGHVFNSFETACSFLLKDNSTILSVLRPQVLKRLNVISILTIESQIKFYEVTYAGCGRHWRMPEVHLLYSV